MNKPPTTGLRWTDTSTSINAKKTVSLLTSIPRCCCCGWWEFERGFRLSPGLIRLESIRHGIVKCGNEREGFPWQIVNQLLMSIYWFSVSWYVAVSQFYWLPGSGMINEKVRKGTSKKKCQYFPLKSFNWKDTHCSRLTKKGSRRHVVMTHLLGQIDTNAIGMSAAAVVFISSISSCTGMRMIFHSRHG